MTSPHSLYKHSRCIDHAQWHNCDVMYSVQTEHKQAQLKKFKKKFYVHPKELQREVMMAGLEEAFALHTGSGPAEDHCCDN